MSSRQKSQGIARSKRPAVVAASAGAGPVVGVVARTPAGLLVRSEGQRLLIELPYSSAEIGRRVGRSKQIVASYRSGGAVPSPEVRRALEKAFPEVRAHAWSDRPSEAADEARADAIDRVSGPNQDALNGVLNEFAALLDEARLIRSDKKALPAERLKAMQISESLLARKAKLKLESLQADNELEARLTEMPRFKHFERALMKALKPHPEAMKAVIAALEAL